MKAAAHRIHEPRHGLVLRLALLVLAAIPLGTGLFGVAAGLQVGPGNAALRADYFDSEYRFLSGVWVGVGVTLVWAVVRLSERRQVVGLMLSVIGCGVLARIAGILAHGWPPFPFVIALVVEIIYVPAVAALFVVSGRTAA